MAESGSEALHSSLLGGERKEREVGKKKEGKSGSLRLCHNKKKWAAILTSRRKGRIRKEKKRSASRFFQDWGEGEESFLLRRGGGRPRKNLFLYRCKYRKEERKSTKIHNPWERIDFQGKLVALLHKRWEGKKKGQRNAFATVTAKGEETR